MTNQQVHPDANVVISELTIQIANLCRENAILKATIQAMNQTLKISDGGELQS